MPDEEVKPQPSNDGSDPIESQPKEKAVDLERHMLTINPRAFNGVSNNKKRELLKTFSQITHLEVSRSFSGPLPAPELLRQYNDIDPTITKTITDMAVREMEHTHTRDQFLLDQSIQLKKRGQIFGFSIAMTAIVGGGRVHNFRS
jgi:uncharacterized membrane protein